MFRYSAKIVSSLLKSKKISCFITFIFLKEKFSGKFHENNISVIAKLRGLSNTTIKEHIQQLVEFGFLEDRGLLGENGKGNYFVIGNVRYNNFNGLQGRDCIIFDHVYDNRLGLNNDLTIDEKLMAFKDMKKLRTYLHVCLQYIAVNKYLKPKLTPEQEFARIEALKKKAELKKERRLAKKLAKINIPQVNPNSNINKVESNTKSEVHCASSKQYSVSSTYLNKTLGTHQNGFSSPTIRNHQNKSVKLGFMTKDRVFNILACTKAMKDYHEVVSYKHNLDFSDTFITDSQTIQNLYKNSDRSTLYSPLFLWVNNPLKQTKVKKETNILLENVQFKKSVSDLPNLGKLGTISALVQEVSPTVSYNVSIGKFRKKKYLLPIDPDADVVFKKNKKVQSFRPKLTLETMTCNLINLEVTEF